LVYALEGLDNGGDLASLIVPEQQTFETIPAPAELPEGTQALRGRGFRETDASGGELYFEGIPPKSETSILAVPSALWGNREAGGEPAMRIWLRTQEAPT